MLKQTCPSIFILNARGVMLGAAVLGAVGATALAGTNCVAPPAGLVSWWPGEGNPSDAVGGNNGTLYQGTTFAPGLVGQAFSFDGVDDCVTNALPGLTNIQDSFTMEFWAYPTATRGTTPEATSGISGNGGQRYAIYPNYSDAAPVGAGVSVGTNGVSVFEHGNAYLASLLVHDTPIAGWTHIAVVYENRQPKLYLNGVLARTGLTSTRIPYPSTVLGENGAQSGNYGYYAGLLDEVSIYGRSLTAAEVQSIYAAGNAGKCQPLTNAPPIILTQLQDQTVSTGGSVTFTVSATGTWPFSYQWFFNSTPISGRTTFALSLNDVQPAQAGVYFVVITNAFGLATSSNAALAVLTHPPTITTQPVGQTVVAGAAATFRATATGSSPLAYQWFFNSSPLNGATRTSLILSSVALSQAGNYWVQVTNAWGSTESSNAALAVIDLGPNFFDDFEPGIDTLQWSGFSTAVRATNYGGAVSGTNSLWFGGTSPRYAITRPLDTTAGGVVEFYLRLAKGTSPTWDSPELPGDGVVVDYSKNGGSTWTQLARYDTPPYTNWTFCAVTIPLAAQAPGTLFRWRQPISGGSNLDHWALDDVAVFIGPRPPQITNQPASQAALVGQDVAFSVGVRGTAPLGYQWLVNGTNLAGATASSLTLTNVQFGSAGSYSVVVTNEAGSATSSNALLTVSLPPAALRILNVSAVANTEVSVPIVMVANGNENALGFSLNFNPEHLAYAGVALGVGAPGGSLLFNTSQIAEGRLGVAIALPADTTFVAGTQEIAQVSFTARVLTNATVSILVFGDQPIGRQLADAPGNVLAATYASGSVSISAVDYEGDVSPRPDGNKVVTITDWVMVGRYAARLDYPTNASEFQRADSAPRTTMGDGAIKITDWVQAGRYAAGLDALTPVGGPTSEVAGAPRRPRDSGTCRVRAADVVFVQGHAGTLSVLLEAQGGEAGVGFSLSFDPACLSYVSTALGSGASGASLNVNASQAAAGKLGLGLMLPTGTSFAAGTQEIVKVTFSAAAAATGNCAVAFGDLPVPRDVSDAGAGTLTASYVSSTVTVNPPPALVIAQQGQDVTMSWPLWAINFVLQTATEASPSSGVWTNVEATVNAANGERTVTLPRTGNATFYRLYRP